MATTKKMAAFLIIYQRWLLPSVHCLPGVKAYMFSYRAPTRRRLLRSSKGAFTSAPDDGVKIKSSSIHCRDSRIGTS